MIRAPANGPEAIIFAEVTHDFGSLAAGTTTVEIVYTAPENRHVWPTPVGVPPDDVHFECHWAPGRGGLLVKAINDSAASITVGTQTFCLMLVDTLAASPE